MTHVIIRSMRLTDEQEARLEENNKAMRESDVFKCPSCKAEEIKCYCGKCDNFYYKCYHKVKCKTPDYGNIECMC